MKCFSVLLITCLVLSSECSVSSAQDRPFKKSDLRILYVGANPEPESAKQLQATRTLPKNFPERRRELALNRPSEFKSFLNQYFDNVTIMTSIDYVPSDSDSHDVTIFDQVPGYVDGQLTFVELPSEFSNSAILIGDAGTGIPSNSHFPTLLDHL